MRKKQTEISLENFPRFTAQRKRKKSQSGSFKRGRKMPLRKVFYSRENIQFLWPVYDFLSSSQNDRNQVFIIFHDKFISTKLREKFFILITFRQSHQTENEQSAIGWR
jgi:hypothetical protein